MSSSDQAKLKLEFSFNLIGSQNAVHSAVQLGWNRFLYITTVLGGGQSEINRREGCPFP